MRRSLALLALAVLAFFVGTWFARPLIVKAGHTPGLSGRTHLIVKEHNLKILTGVGTFPGGTPMPLRERFRDGTTSMSAYVVPAQTVFVLTDVQACVPGSDALSIINGAIGDTGTGPGFERWRIFASFPSGAGPLGKCADIHFTGGIPYNPGSTIVVVHSSNQSFFQVNALGYETVDV